MYFYLIVSCFSAKIKSAIKGKQNLPKVEIECIENAFSSVKIPVKEYFNLSKKSTSLKRSITNGNENEKIKKRQIEQNIKIKNIPILLTLLTSNKLDFAKVVTFSEDCLFTNLNVLKTYI